MNQSEKELLLNSIEHKVGIVATFYRDVEGAEDLLNLYEEYKKEGTSITEIKLFLDDLNTFLRPNGVIE